MKKFFLAVLSITFGLVLALAILGGGIYWWIEVRIPAPPKISVELDGFPDVRKQENGEARVLVRIVVTNNDDLKISINDAYLYLIRVSDGARAKFRFDVDDMVIYPKEKFVEIVETTPVKHEWVDFKASDEFDSEDDYQAHKTKWIAQLKETFKFNFAFVSDKQNIRIFLDAQKKSLRLRKKMSEKRMNNKSA
jgi:XapX domain-containing protein